MSHPDADIGADVQRITYANTWQAHLRLSDMVPMKCPCYPLRSTQTFMIVGPLPEQLLLSLWDSWSLHAENTPAGTRVLPQR